MIAPDTLPPEVAHALTSAERRGILTAEEGVAHFTALLKGLPEIHASLPLLPRAYELSSQMRLGVFDCLYISLAEREQCQVVTADQRIIQLFPVRARLGSPAEDRREGKVARPFQSFQNVPD